ncbi:MAG: hypothetical protein RMM17_08420 [Acidobacteriota bacterium]|nr:hypothetical protein [Blastocatellia bacterium]MDW8412691.1 hypothetical protein [Acidobacteriota bacterium]
MNYVEGRLKFLDQELGIKIFSALRGCSIEISDLEALCIVGMVDDRQYEPALYHYPCFVLPAEGQEAAYVKFLLALQHAEGFALLAKDGKEEPIALLHPYRNYLMMVMMRPKDELLEPEEPDFSAIERDITPEEVQQLSKRLEHSYRVGV